MAQISDVMHALAVFDAARQELAWAYNGHFTDLPEPMKGKVDAILEVLNEAEMRWVTSTREEPMAAVVDKKNAMVVVAMGDGKNKKKSEDTAVVKELCIVEAEMKINNWFVRLGDVACDMRAVAQKKLLGDYSKTDDKLRARWLPCLPRTSRAARIPSSIDTVARKLEELKQQYDKDFGDSTGGLPLAAICTEQPACSSAAGDQEERETSVTGDVLVGRGNDVRRRTIIDIIHYSMHLFRDSHVTATILPIFGPPCVGKTTLVKSVIHEGSFEAGYKVWFDMCKGWDIESIQKPIIELLGTKDGESYNIWQKLAFNKTRLLLVFDNLVEEQDRSMLEKLLKFLHTNGGGRVIAIVTTRSEALAKYITSFKAGTVVKPYRLLPSSDDYDMCREIIKRTSGLDLEAIAAGNSEAAVVAGQIASKCSGIPLAAKALGRFLQSVDPQEWPRQIRDVWNIGGGFSRDSQQLRRLPIHSATVFTHLKRSSGGVLEVEAESWLSLAYCAFVFPKGKGHAVATCDLLNQWCSLDITTREGGASCISELLNRSLILGEWPASSYASEDATSLRMEDLMHDFARYLLGDRLIVVDGKNGATPLTSSPVDNKSSSAYMALVRNFDAAKQLDISSILPAGILALRFEGCGEMELSDGAFALFGKYLRLLDLSGYSEKKKLPDFIRNLKQLRYLKALGIQDQEFPRSGLHELRYLILHRSCQLSDLTEAFQRFRTLLHLDLSGCSGLKKLPKYFGRLWSLESLDLSACSGIEVLPESFGWLRNLRHLDLSRCSGIKALPDSFGRLLRLEHLDLSECSGLESLTDELFGWFRSLRHLDLAGCSGLKALPGSFHRLAGVLRHLDLSRCSGLENPLASPLNGLQEFHKLRHLGLSDLPGITKLRIFVGIVNKAVGPFNLVHLDLSGCSELTSISLMIPELKYLDLSGCSGLTDISSIHLLERMQYLDLSGCSRLQLSSYTEGILEGIRRRGGRASGPKDASLNSEVDEFC